MGEFTVNSEVENGLNWLCEKSERVLHFGCGDGRMLYDCARRGTKTHMGIDSSPMLITKARRRTANNAYERFYFRCGGSEEFRTLLKSSFDAVIIFDVLDRVREEEGRLILSESLRVLAKKGKALIKLKDAGEGEWNLTTDEWNAVFKESFNVIGCKDVYYKDKDIHERLFLITKPE